MVRSYERHEPTLAFSLICSNAAQGVLDADGKTAFLPALEDVLVWDLKLGQQRAMWHEVGVRTAVTAIARAPYPQQNRVAVGYADGFVRLWDAATASMLLTFHGHQRAVTTLAFDAAGLLLASGSQDTSVIVWDIVAESGQCRLKSHHEPITGVHFLASAHGAATYVLSTARDGLLKLWDLGLQHCVQTVVSGDEQLWSLAVSEAHGAPLVVTGGTAGHVRFWAADADALARGLGARAGVPAADSDAFLAAHGSLDLPGGHRVPQLAFSTTTGDALLAASSGDRSAHIFRVRTLDEARRKQQRQLKRAREKRDKTGHTGEPAPDGSPLLWAARMEPYVTVRPSIGRIRSFSFPTGAPADVANARASIPLLCALTTNSAELHTIPALPRTKVEKAALTEPQVAFALEQPGHRMDIRAVALSADDTLLASVCGSGQLKIWNVRTGRCIRTLPVSAFGLCVTWVPGDRYVLVGCKDGSLHSFDVPAGLPVQSLAAHSGPLWSCAVHPSGLSMATCSADKEVKFWDFEMVRGDAAGVPDAAAETPDATAGAPRAAQQLALVHVRTLKLADDVLCARFSPDARLLAVSLLDNTVKVFYADTLKFFLSLYGHKLPVLSLDISGDSKLCVTCSADKNVKIWGLDFGDCRRSIFAHDDSITCVAFEKGQQGGGLMGGREGASHRFWTVSKDGCVKYWDGDRFVGVQTMQGHHSEVWALATGHQGRVVVTAGADRSIRVWEKTDEPLFLEEEREKELERMYETAVPPAGLEHAGIGELAGDDDAPRPARAEAEAVSLTTAESLTAGERLIDAIALADGDLAARTHDRDAPPHPAIAALFGDQSIESPDTHKYVLRVLEKILPTHLEDALLVLPFDRVIRLLEYVDVWIAKEWNVSLAARVLFFLLRTHHAQIVSNRVLRATLLRLRRHTRDVLQQQKVRSVARACSPQTMIGFNLAALRTLKQQEVARRTAALYERGDVPLDQLDELSVRDRIESKGSKRKRVVVR
ncbi:beta transducin [Malassezia sp. CBS 17886]|nr:beta transducin [Malassezia sp. CBS 17886]